MGECKKEQRQLDPGNRAHGHRLALDLNHRIGQPRDHVAFRFLQIQV
jgi:hypothetical protein